MACSSFPDGPRTSTQSPLISVTIVPPSRIGKAPLGLPKLAGGSCAQFPAVPSWLTMSPAGGLSTTTRQFLMSAATILPPGRAMASSGL